MYLVDILEVLYLFFFLYLFIFFLILVVVRCYNWRGGVNFNWIWLNIVYFGWYYIGDISECFLFMEILWELRLSEKIWIFYFVI